MPIIDTLFDGQRIVLRRPFFAQIDRQPDRDLHSHDCIEFSAVLSGTADHVLHFPDGSAKHQKLSRGNYMILDATVRHAYKNCSKDFSVLNLLFQQSFLRATPADSEENGGDFYELIRELFPDFKYRKVQGSPVNRIYFDKAESVFPLFYICHDSSRQNRHEWQRTVRYALSLILVLSLDSFDRYIRPKKDSIIDTVKEYVETHFAEDVTLTEICAKHFYSVPYVSHRFKEVCGCSFEQYVRQLRIKRAGELLLSTTLSVGEIAERCGYASPRTFRKAFVCVTGISPLAFKKNYQK